MIAVEGSVLPGLDEFMLRLGHLKVLCSVIAAGDGTWRRINRAAGELLNSQVPVDFDTDASVAEYLYRKRLCRVMTLMSVFKQMGQMFGLAKGVFCSSFSCYAACR